MHIIRRDDASSSDSKKSFIRRTPAFWLALSQIQLPQSELFGAEQIIDIANRNRNIMKPLAAVRPSAASHWLLPNHANSNKTAQTNRERSHLAALLMYIYA